MLRLCTLVTTAALAALAITAVAEAAPPRLSGTVGPGFTITLKRFNKPLRTLKAGRYLIVVADKSSIHNFHLRGPGVNKEITAVGFVGTKTIAVTLKKGRYTFVCDPHATSMKGSFTVT
ncbi:MAG TPA: plastocyanin/azurin family copper-binding protein [Gaiellaceae bacterium]|nr:plastocyanin/azurin family copper-binding protein [Gaiellaceae bacterium]